MDCPNGGFRSLIAWKGTLAALIYSPGPGHVQREMFSQPRGHEPEGENVANLACKKYHLVLV
jgi:hypothetical protein